MAHSNGNNTSVSAELKDSTGKVLFQTSKEINYKEHKGLPELLQNLKEVQESTNTYLTKMIEDNPNSENGKKKESTKVEEEADDSESGDEVHTPKKRCNTTSETEDPKKKHCPSLS